MFANSLLQAWSPTVCVVERTLQSRYHEGNDTPEPAVVNMGMQLMNRSLMAPLVVLVGVLAATMVAGASQSSGVPPASAPAQQPGSAAAAQADERNTATFTRVCSTCHDAARILSNRRTKDQWSEVIDKMVERGAQGTDDDFAEIIDYLVGHYGRINVNRGTAKDLATVLKVSDKDAEAIVAFRTANGPFADFDGLAKVPDIDMDTLKQNRDAISF
jgi:competence protein ComEA